MHNIKEIRTDFDYFKNQLKSRNIDVDIDKIKELDETNRKYIQKKRLLRVKKRIFLNLKMKVYLKDQKKYQKNLKLLQMSKNKSNQN
jgi:seryl-tRNA synthetase